MGVLPGAKGPPQGIGLSQEWFLAMLYLVIYPTNLQAEVLTEIATATAMATAEAIATAAATAIEIETAIATAKATAVGNNSSE